MKLAIFVDAENELAQMLPAVVEKLQENHSIVMCGVYGKKSSIGQKWHNLITHGIKDLQLHHINVPKGKNKADNEIMDDITEMLENKYISEQVDGYVLVTHDKDFRRIIPNIRNRNKQVIIACSNGFLAFQHVQVLYFDKSTKNVINIEPFKFIRQIIEFMCEDQIKQISISALGNYLKNAKVKYHNMRLSKIITALGYSVENNNIIL